MMSRSEFPRRRAEGTFSIAIRYAPLRPDAAQALHDHVAEWVARKEAAGHLDLAAELVRAPHVNVVDTKTLEVVFDCRPTSMLGKGLMVELASELDAFQGANRIGFWDLVAEVPHAASVNSADTGTP